MRTKNLISFPRFNRQNGDVNKKWYVEFAFRVPGDDTPYRYRVYAGLCSGSVQERDAVGQRLVDYYTEYLKSGEYLNTKPNLNPLKENETYRPENKKWMEKNRELMMDRLMPRFLKSIGTTLRKKTHQDYSSKMSIFLLWLDKNGLIKTPVTLVGRATIMPFFEMLATERKLCRRTIEKYMQILRAFFNWCEDMGLREYDTNPIRRIPKMGKVIDCSPDVFSKTDRERLRDAIKPKEPWLWLACEMLYYCAIRPGTEMRLLKVSDIDLERRTIRVDAELAKNKRTELVAFPGELLQHMLELNLDKYAGNMYVFGRYGAPSLTPMGKNTMRNRFNQYRELLKISSDKKFYSWKHSGAISAIENGATIYEVKDQLRHVSVMTTEEYLRKRVPKSGIAADKMDKI